MTNEIVRAITGDGLVKAAAITGRDIVERARNIHKLLPMGTAALGRALMGASMMGDMLKEERGAVTLQIKGGGPLGTILAVSDHEGNVRGYVQNPQVELMELHPGKLDVGRAVGTDGTLTVMKDIGLKEPYVGSIGLFSGEIADDLAMYFVESEQIPTACALGVLVGLDQSVTAAGGYLIQLLPGASEEMIAKIEAGVRGVSSVSHALARGMDGEGLLRAVLKDFDLEVLEKHPVEYRCYCSRDRVSRALISMGKKDLSELIEEQGRAELTCQFCDQVYQFSREELEALHLDITTQYTQKPEDLPEEGQEGGEPAGGTESGNEVSQPWMSYPLDPETGYRVDPETGRFFDPQTGEPIDGGESVPDPNLPVNPNLPTTPNVQ